ncbi:MULTISPECIES: DUF5822 domain-containing protein [Halolamina]|uniref:Peptidoglycan-binding protein n=1 Tax=Halolamina pelagica TaxID=699431 RepID=A0A1I5Q188_9EURY|nr:MULTISPECIES: DUF5822 domain-containing protein [Halolamina]NHX35042.1 hypothetical protein [Halolamina sp. R1-12]SFP39770.1 hypothetical protein SAMN05216277_103199 [Halolamina pelagica]
MPEHVATTDPDGVDFGWVMQVTFVLTIVVGAPLVALLSTQVTLPSWPARASFAIRVGAPVWVLTGLCVYLYARWRDQDDE